MSQDVRPDVRVSAPTENRHPGTTGIDEAATVDVLRLINAEDAKVAPAVAAVLPTLAGLVDVSVEAIRHGHQVHYFGAGTSGRLAVVDAAELRPTFNAPPDMVIAHHAGGTEALLRAVENVEDDWDLGAEVARVLRPGDVAIGLTASGRTPWVGGALTTARARGVVTALVTANPGAELADLADYLLAVDTGPEAVTGSTRLKAGTAQKLVLNAFSTALMVRLGRTWSNLMVDLVATNAKLRGRVVRILQEASGADEEAARAALESADGELKPALLSMLAGVTAVQARAAITAHDGSVAQALATLREDPSRRRPHPPNPPSPPGSPIPPSSPRSPSPPSSLSPSHGTVPAPPGEAS